jgi:ATP-dependent Zn protease
MTGLLTLLLVVMGALLLYAYRSQTPSVQSVSYTEAVREINAGQVKKVTIVGSQATLELQSMEKQQLTLPERPDAFQKVLDDYNAANPSRPVQYEYRAGAPGVAVIGSIFLSLLPIVLLGAGFLYLTSRLRPR